MSFLKWQQKERGGYVTGTSYIEYQNEPKRSKQNSLGHYPYMTSVGLCAGYHRNIHVGYPRIFYQLESRQWITEFYKVNTGVGFEYIYFIQSLVGIDNLGNAAKEVKKREKRNETEKITEKTRFHQALLNIYSQTKNKLLTCNEYDKQSTQIRLYKGIQV